MVSDSANVRSIAALDELRASLVRYADEVRQALGAAEQETQRTLEWLRERLNYWQREVQRCEDVARAAQRAYDYCRSQLICVTDENGTFCYPPPCTAQEAALREAVRQLRAAQTELQNVQLWNGRVQQANAEYQTQARHLSDVTNNTVPQAGAQLTALRDHLLGYVDITAPIAGNLPSPPPPSSSGSSGETVSSLDALGQLFGGLAAAPIVAASLGQVADTAVDSAASSPLNTTADVEQRVRDLERETLAREQAKLEEIRRQQANTPPTDPPTDSPASPPPAPPPGWTPPHGAGSPDLERVEYEPDHEGRV